MSVIPTIVIVEDDQDLSTYLQEMLTAQRYTVYPVSEGTKAIKLVEEINPQLVLLDLTLPDITGETVCKQLKSLFPTLPIIMLTAKDDTNDVVAGFTMGADDYVTKPFNGDELLARIQARLRQAASDHIIKVGDLVINTETFEVERDKKPIPLTFTEYSLLHYFVLNKNRVLTREMILSNVWSFTPDIETRVVDVYVGYLRKKIDKGFSSKLIHSSRGFGYMFRDDQAT